MTYRCIAPCSKEARTSDVAGTRRIGEIRVRLEETKLTLSVRLDETPHLSRKVGSGQWAVGSESVYITSHTIMVMRLRL